MSHTQDKHLRQPKAVVCRGQHKRLSARHLPHGTRQFQVVVGLFQDSVLTHPSEAELNWKFENKVLKFGDKICIDYYDRKIKMEDENPTVGIIICKDKKDAIVEMTLPENNNQIFASRYQTVLPSKEELKQLLEDKKFEID